MNPDPGNPASVLRARLTPLAACLAAALAMGVADSRATAFGAGRTTPLAVIDTTAPIVVGNCNDAGAGSFRQAVADAPAGSTIDLSQLQCSTITLSTGTVFIDEPDLTLHGPGADLLTITSTGAGTGQRTIAAYASGTLHIDHLTISNQTTACLYSQPDLYLDHAVVTHCNATGSTVYNGAGIFAGHDATLSHSEVSYNSLLFALGTAKGGGIYAQHDLTLEHSVVSHNSVDSASPYLAAGGGVSVNSTLKAYYSVIFANAAGQNAYSEGRAGGANVMNAELHHSTISGNVANYGVGGLGVLGVGLLYNSTISGNQGFRRGGLYCNCSALGLYSNTIAANIATSALDGGGITIAPSFPPNLMFYNNLVANNTSSGQALDLYIGPEGGIVDGSNNLIVSSSGFGALPLDTITGVDPHLLPLADNGGPTKTMALPLDSVAIDAGIDVAGLVSDQRGEPYLRTAGPAPDIGAFENNQPRLLLGPAGLEFGNVRVGSNSAAMTFTASNFGGFDLHLVMDVPTAPFHRTGGTCSAPPITIAGGQSCSIAFGFSPQVSGDAEQILAFTSDSGTDGADGQITLHGMGVIGLLEASPSTLDFGSVKAGDVSPSLSVHLKNAGTATLDITDVDSPAAPFVAAGGSCGTPPTALVPNASCTLDYRFAPTVAGSAVQTLFVQSDGGNVVFNLQGTGLEGDLTITPTMLDFGNVGVGDSAIAQSVTFGNNGGATIHVSSVEPAIAPFAATGGSCGAPPFDIAPSASCTVAYLFEPASEGVASQALAVNSDAGVGQVSLIGTGVIDDRIFKGDFDP